MEPEQAQYFNERLNQWVASQGFWFQLRHSLSLKGDKHATLHHVALLAFRAFLFLLVLSAATWVFLVKRTDAKWFRDGLKQSIASALGATGSKMEGFKREQGQLMITNFSGTGGRDTFFSSLEARHIRCDMGLLARVRSTWNLGNLRMAKLNIELRAGADDEESAEAFARTFFRELEHTRLSSIEVADAFVTWGYSENARGFIEGSHLKARRSPNGWNLVFEGGSLNQNWLKGLEIEQLVVNCSKQGFVFEKASFRKGGGTIDLGGLRLTAGEMPTVEGTAKIRQVSVRSILPSSASGFVDGNISGDFQIAGSTNSAEGLTYEARLNFNETDHFILRDRIHLLRALTVIDSYNNYRRLEFQEGSLLLRITKGLLEVRDIKLKSGELMTVTGEITTRFPTEEETRKLLENPTADLSQDDEDRYVPETYSADEELDLSLNASRKEALKSERKNAVSMPDAKELAEQATLRASRILHYEGMLRITLPPDSFEQAESLRKSLTPDPETGRIPMEVPLEGTLQQLTQKQAEALYERGRR